MNGLLGKRVLITGGTSGIGQAIAVRFAAIGLLIALLVLPSLIGACKTIDLWHQKQTLFFANHPEFCAALALNRKPWIERQGLLLPQLMPFVFVIFWLVIHVASYFL